jgi:ABC-type xylose transport system permease subunit
MAEIRMKKSLSLSARNIFIISVQTVSVGIMATGMVFVIVARHIDLSIGSLLAICSALMAESQIEWLPQVFGLCNPVVLVATIVFGLALARLPAGWLTENPASYHHLGRPADLAQFGLVYHQWPTGGTDRSEYPDV